MSRRRCEINPMEITVVVSVVLDYPHFDAINFGNTDGLSIRRILWRTGAEVTTTSSQQKHSHNQKILHVDTPCVTDSLRISSPLHHISNWSALISICNVWSWDRLEMRKIWQPFGPMSPRSSTTSQYSTSHNPFKPLSVTRSFTRNRNRVFCVAKVRSPEYKCRGYYCSDCLVAVLRQTKHNTPLEKEKTHEQRLLDHTTFSLHGL